MAGRAASAWTAWVTLADEGEPPKAFAAEHPRGLCNDFYNDGFGTLWSVIFDVARDSLDVCFSAPTHNKYYPFNLKEPVGMVEYPVVVPVKKTRLSTLGE